MFTGTQITDFLDKVGDRPSSLSFQRPRLRAESCERDLDLTASLPCDLSLASINHDDLVPARKRVSRRGSRQNSSDPVAIDPSFPSGSSPTSHRCSSEYRCKLPRHRFSDAYYSRKDMESISGRREGARFKQAEDQVKFFRSLRHTSVDSAFGDEVSDCVFTPDGGTPELAKDFLSLAMESPCLSANGKPANLRLLPSSSAGGSELASQLRQPAFSPLLQSSCPGRVGLEKMACEDSQDSVSDRDSPGNSPFECDMSDCALVPSEAVCSTGQDFSSPPRSSLVVQSSSCEITPVPSSTNISHLSPSNLQEQSVFLKGRGLFDADETMEMTDEGSSLDTTRDDDSGMLLQNNKLDTSVDMKPGLQTTHSLPISEVSSLLHDSAHADSSTTSDCIPSNDTSRDHPVQKVRLLEGAPRYRRSASVPARGSVRVRLFDSESPSSFSNNRLMSHGLCTENFQTMSADHASTAPGVCTSPLAQSNTLPSPQPVELCKSDSHCTLPGLSSLLTAPLLSTPVRSPLAKSSSQSSRKMIHRLLSAPLCSPNLDGGEDRSDTPTQRFQRRSQSASVFFTDSSPALHVGSWANSKVSAESKTTLCTKSDLSSNLSSVLSAPREEAETELEQAGHFFSPCTPVSIKRCHSESYAGAVTKENVQDVIDGKKTLFTPCPISASQRLFASTSSPQINAAYGIVSPGQTGVSLIGDFTRGCSLPVLCKGPSRGVDRISWSTATSALQGHSELPGKLVIIDCRYPYEYSGGHIAGAINLSTADDIVNHFMSSSAVQYVKELRAQGQVVIPIFHCEFSVKRSVELYLHLRKKDRELHIENYPQLFYPEMYLLAGGYKDFFENCREMCDPPHYVSMNDKKFAGEMYRFSRSKTFSGLKSDAPKFRQRNSFKL